MSEKSISDFIQSILEEHKGFMKVKDIPAAMDFDMRCKLGLMKNTAAKKVMRVLEPFVEDRFIFRKKGNTEYILVPCDPSEFVMNSLKAGEATGPKLLRLGLPFNVLDFRDIVNELVEAGKIKILLNDKLKPVIILTDGHEGHDEKDENAKSRGQYTRERFKAAFDELERGQTFVNIPELRKKLAWPHDVFDEMLRKLRDEGVVQLHKTDLTIFDPEDFFYDEENARRGMVTWHDR